MRISFFRRFCVVTAVLGMLSGGAGHAQTAAPPAAPASVSSPAQAQMALDVLKDPAKRAQMIAVLEALAKAGAAAPSVASAPAPTPVPPPAAPSAPAAAVVAALPLAPDSLGAQLLVDASERLSDASKSVTSAMRSMTDFPLIWRWIVQTATDPWSQARLTEALWKLALVGLAALLVEWSVLRLLRPAHRSLAARSTRLGKAADDLPASEWGIDAAEAGHTEKFWRRLPTAMLLVRRVPLVLARLLLEMLPVLAMLATGYALVAAGLGADATTRVMILGLLHAYAACRVATGLVRVVFGPGEPRLAMVPDAAAGAVLRWVRRIVAVAAFGYALTEIGLLFGLYRVAYDALMKLVVLTVHILLVAIVLQQRGAVARWLRADKGATGPTAALRNQAASLWHFAAIFYLIALWAVWAMDVPNGFYRLLRLFVLTGVILTLARLLALVVLGGLDRAANMPAEAIERYPTLHARMGVYHPFVRGVAVALLSALSLLALFEVWGLNVLGWFTGNALGGRLVSAITTIGITVLLALVVWEGVNAAVQQHLSRLAREAQIAKSARLRTLLPMLRTALLISIGLVAGLMILSEIGVNIAPLLAGAGVLGLAIGFGSQKLVQDIITGLFLLLENTMQVGDTVTLGGMTGTVETLSVRTIRLRAVDGSIHIVPFSAVTTVTNMTRDFGYAVLDVQVGLNEEPDHIADVLREIAREMRGEERWKPAIREDLDVMGVERFLNTAFVLRARIRTSPAQRWAVGRELNRRIKYKFDELAIESPMTSYRALHQSPPILEPSPDEGVA